MEAFGIIGMSLGSSGLVFGLIALTQITELKKELEELKSTLKKSGVIGDETSEEKED
tara:strand:- start:927 stop:1097 length:171 start_codon:yes stop_codon:yes gene_type:complete